MYIPMFITALFTIAQIWKQAKCPSIDKWIKNICTMEYYSAIKNEILPFATAWMDLEDITVSELEKYYMISLICGI